MLSNFERSAAAMAETSRLLAVQQSLDIKLCLSLRRHAWTKRTIERCCAQKCKAVRHDQRQAVLRMAAKIQSLEDAGDTLKSYKLIKRLSGVAPRPLKGLKNKTGDILRNEIEIRQRWIEHYTEVLSATFANSLDEACPQCTPKFQVGSFWPSLYTIFCMVISLDGNRGVGTDQISAFFYKIAPWSVARFLLYVIRRAILEERFPGPWRGSRLCNLFKKGSPLECDNYRGLSVGDHIAKVLAGLLYDHLCPFYMKAVGSDQFGATPLRGSDFASHILRSFIDLALARGMSCFILFCDLIKAFDFAVRELIFGYTFDSSSADEARKHEVFKSLNLPDDVAKHIVSWLEEHGPILEKLGVDKKAFALCKSLYTGSWATKDGCNELFVSRSGGRQGCRLGAVIFNLIYAVALHHTRTELALLGITMTIHFDIQQLFACAGVAHTFTFNNKTVSDGACDKTDIDVTFVDDEAFMSMASAPYALSEAIRKSCCVFQRLFIRLGSD